MSKLFRDKLYLIIFAGIILRSVYPGTFIFGIDQVQIVTAAEKIVQGDLTLIGPKTGPAPIFIGPAIYYFVAFFSLFTEAYYALFISTICISIITGLSLLFLIKKYLIQKLHLSVLIIWAFSPFLVNLDRISWNPSLSILASSLVFFPLIKKSLTRLDVLLIALGVFLGYQAHFSNIMLLPISILCVLKTKNSKISASISIISAFLLSLLPTLLFDARNNWLNVRGLISLLESGNNSVTGLFPAILSKFYLVLETLGRILLTRADQIFVVVIAAIVVILYLNQNKDRENDTKKTVLVWVATIATTFALYSGTTPDYYYLLLVPVFLYILSQVFLTYLNPAQLKTFGIIFVLFSSFTIYRQLSLNTGFPISAQLKALSFIQNTEAIASIDYDMDLSESTGIRYLLEKNPPKYDASGQVVHIIFPVENETPFVTKKLTNNSSLWIDSRTNKNLNYLSTNEYIIETPKNIQLFEVHDPTLRKSSNTVYFIYKTDANTGEGFIYVYDAKSSNDEYKLLVNLFGNSSEPVTINFKSETQYLFAVKNNFAFTTTYKKPNEFAILFE